MSDIEERLAQAGRAWRAEQPDVRPARPRERRGGRWLPAVAAVAVVALALGAVLLGDRASDRDPRPAPASGGRGTWEAMAPGPLAARLNPVMAGWGDSVVVVGGRIERPCPPNASCVRDLRETQRDGALYDVPSRSWTPLPPAPRPLDASSSAVVGDVLYLWLPQEGGDRPAVLALDLAARTWHELPRPPAVPGGYLRLVAAGGQLVAHHGEVGRADAVDLMWVPGPGEPDDGRWEVLPTQPFGASYDRSMVWTGETLVLVTPGAPPSQERTGPPFLRAAVLEGQSWRVLPDQEVVIGGSSDWSWTGDRVVSATTYEADGGQVNGFGRSIPSGGYLDPRTGVWSVLPEAPTEQERAGRAPAPSAAGGRWVANGEGLVLDTREQRWIVLPPQPEQADQDASAAWAAGRLVVWGGAAGVLPAPEPDEARLLDSGAVWTPPA
jgi:hypothetical protein